MVVQRDLASLTFEEWLDLLREDPFGARITPIGRATETQRGVPQPTGFTGSGRGLPPELAAQLPDRTVRLINGILNSAQPGSRFIETGTGNQTLAEIIEFLGSDIGQTWLEALPQPEFEKLGQRFTKRQTAGDPGGFILTGLPDFREVSLTERSREATREFLGAERAFDKGEISSAEFKAAESRVKALGVERSKIGRRAPTARQIESKRQSQLGQTSAGRRELFSIFAPSDVSEGQRRFTEGSFFTAESEFFKQRADDPGLQFKRFAKDLPFLERFKSASPRAKGQFSSQFRPPTRRLNF